MKLEELAQGLHPLERKVLPFLRTHHDAVSLISASGLKEVEVIRALQWLSNKDIVLLDIARKKVVELDRNGTLYKENGLPEKRFLAAIQKKSLSLDAIGRSAGLGKDELNVCIGLLKRKAAIDTKKGKVLTCSITENGKKILAKETLEERFLKQEFPLPLDSLQDELRFAFDELSRRRQILRIREEKTTNVRLTEAGKRLAAMELTSDVLESLTPGMLKQGTWKGKTFRKYDVSINVPSISGGRRHFVNQTIRAIKDLWLELGFKEMKGPHIMTEFWDLDALFVPQDHPARYEQDTFFIKKPKQGSLPPVWKKVRDVHETGGDTGSRGWGGRWDRDQARQNILITHDTYLSAKVLAETRPEDLPVKTFQVMKVFRNESLDWKHLFEFYQVGGIVIDPDVTFRHLLGYLRTFFRKMGFEKVRIRPAHFPYTEPSAEVEGFHPVKKQWIELGGSGIFRPELVKPLLGIDVPVLAWGLGIERHRLFRHR
ncbi:MAG: phenylalanine--tRNA ligase subunit alpha [DPANN group archaeon]|nr:phenylalanine--tRNA ligase subunit alpha [DPANN group archaeon]